MQTVLLVIHLLIALALVITILLQRSEGGGLGMGGGGGGGGGGGLFSARGAANALSRTTAILATCFMISSLGLAVFASQTRDRGSLLDVAPAAVTTEQPAPTDGSQGVPLSQ